MKMKLFNLPPHLFDKVSDGVFKLLLDSGSDVSSSDEFHTTPLGYMAINNRIDRFELLLDYGADISVRDDIFDDTVLNVMALNDKYEYIEMILSHEKNDERRNFVLEHAGINKRTPLMLACMYNDIKTIKLLLSYGANAMCVDVDGDIVLRNIIFNEKIIDYVYAFELILNSVDEYQRRTLINHVTDNGRTVRSMIRDGYGPSLNNEQRQKILELLES